MKTPKWLSLLFLLILVGASPAKAEDRVFDMEMIVTIPHDRSCQVKENEKNTALPVETVRFFCNIARRTLDHTKYSIIYVYQRSELQKNDSGEVDRHAHLVLLGAGTNDEPFALHRSFAFGENIPQAEIFEAAIHNFFDGTEDFSAEYYDSIPFYNSYEAADFAEHIIPVMPNFEPEYSLGDSVEKARGVLWAIREKAKERGEVIPLFEEKKQDRHSEPWYRRRMQSFRERPSFPWARGMDIRTMSLRFNFLESRPFLPYFLSDAEQALMEEIVLEQFDLLRAFSEGEL
ncbi:hypothetical protein HYV44_00190 [Candidatus Microgenomates bacterium]|nr:hypothetical protein [Candidatus Microgenomates bacterium]